MLSLIDQFWPYALITFWAFLAATILPLSSEVALLAQIKSGFGSVGWLVAAATVGNVGGSALNWWLGASVLRFQERWWFPFKAEVIAAATQRFNRYGVWVLLLSWLPVIGDPLTLIAGLLRVPLAIFLPLVAIGRAARYLVVAWVA